MYFVSDRDGTTNVWSMDENGGDLKQHTKHAGWDVKRPALDAGRLVYQVGAEDPDIVVDNPPHTTFLGQDAQLDAAIAHLLAEIKKDPRPVPKPPAYPDKSFKYPQR